MRDGGIRIIPESPQAKRRIERNHGTQQDRLVKTLRQGVATYETANAYLAAAYLQDHNQRFVQAPAAPDDFHVGVPRGLAPAAVFRFEA